jgi:hypothetical protein
MQNKVLRNIGTFPGCTPARDSHTGLNLMYVYDYVIKLCRNKQKSYRIVRMDAFAVQCKVKPVIETIRGLTLTVVKLTVVQVTKPPLQHKIRKIGMICSVNPVLTEDLCVVQMEDFSNKRIHKKQTNFLVREVVT